MNQVKSVTSKPHPTGFPINTKFGDVHFGPLYKHKWRNQKVPSLKKETREKSLEVEVMDSQRLS